MPGTVLDPDTKIKRHIYSPKARCPSEETDMKKLSQSNEMTTELEYGEAEKAGGK